LDGVYIDLLLWVCNFIGVKFGLSIMGDDVLELIDWFDFDCEFGWFIFISCMGVGCICDVLFVLVEIVVEVEG